ncbi:MAG: hypothetical protein ABWY11_26965 [Umezawaea sp.]
MTGTAMRGHAGERVRPGKGIPAGPNAAPVRMPLDGVRPHDPADRLVPNGFGAEPPRRGADPVGLRDSAAHLPPRFTADPGPVPPAAKS